ncbi:MAG: type IV toxin-antitoxin system AbiEi family antitoxin domain-containing protein [Solirubrobacterales bacterium]
MVARIASRQHGVVSYEQLIAAGLTPSGVARRVRAGRLHRIHRGVYAVGHRGLSNEGRWMAAVLACGPDAALSHRSAAGLLGLLRPRENAWVHVTIPGTAGRKRRRGIHLHRSPYLTNPLTTTRNGIRVTTPARTIADLKLTAPAHEVRRATRQAEFLGLPLDHPTDGTRSDLERLFPVHLPSPPPPEARGERPDRPLQGRLPLARDALGGRNRRLDLPPRSPGARG